MKASRILLLPFLGGALLSLLTGCANPKAPDNNNSPPTASFWDFEVTGAGTAEVNGGYNLDGTWPTVPPQRQYTKTDGNYHLFTFWDYDLLLRYWGINATLQDGVVPSTLAYYNTSTSNQSAPPSSSWTAGTGGAGAPTVSRWSITGDTATTGNLLTAHYHFSDPDGDGEGTSLYQWYRFEFESETDTLSGTAVGTSITYTTVAEDATRWLRFQVTPVDDQGNQGDPVLSGPTFQINLGT
jgi:hypothetical protein